jgi:hypothetical protein
VNPVILILLALALAGDPAAEAQFESREETCAGWDGPFEAYDADAAGWCRWFEITQTNP